VATNVLNHYENINIKYINLLKYSRNTPLENFFQTNQIQKSIYPSSHLSDVLRYLTLWKYGGTYLDLDVIVQKPLDSIPPNYAGSESKWDVNSAVINLENGPFGHFVADLFVK
jgi:lactosylceramide 4-alpha-galactosyltransferase